MAASDIGAYRATLSTLDPVLLAVFGAAGCFTRSLGDPRAPDDRIPQPEDNSKEASMPFYKIHEMSKKAGKINPNISSSAVVGEYMKFGIVHKPEGEGPPLHEHPNEEQFTVVIEGELHFILGDEDRVVGPGTLIHIPRNTRHRSRPVNGPATFLTVKSPAGDGRLDQDYHLRPEAEEVEALYPGVR